jgi:multidrug efflux pump subunit AcrB
LEVRFLGRDSAGNLALARELIDRLSRVRGAVDVTLREVLDQPEWFVRIDRTRALQVGVTPQEASQTLLAALGSAGTLVSSVWADAAVGLSYDVQVIAPPAQLNSIEQILNFPVRATSGGTVPLRAFAEVVEQKRPASLARTTLQPTFTVVANVQDRDLGGVSRELSPILDELRKNQKSANRIEIAGQAALMDSSYREMLGGLALAAVLVFLVMVVNFQSWTLPFVAMSGLPFALAGAFSFLWLTETPLSVPALMGVIMVVGVSTANSVLVTSFARDRQLEGMEARSAALDAASTRLRPVLMTALAMILGVIPMALGLGEGGEQNAPLGRAVIGGLLFGTGATLLLVPVIFAFVRRRFKPSVDDNAEEHPRTQAGLPSASASSHATAPTPSPP